MRERINSLAGSKTPFLFCLDYEAKDGFVYPLESLPDNIAFEIGGRRHGRVSLKQTPKIVAKTPISAKNYASKITAIKEKIAKGDVYMANLTAPTHIELAGDLEDVFCASKAYFKLLVKDRFVVSSPEAFVRVEDGKIFTYPMKGTAAFEDETSAQTLLDSQKELAEHTMTVDLLRNDLSIVGERVKVNRFRYPLMIEANGQKLIQTVSEISADLPPNFMLGDAIFALLPAGSITGTPKKKCVEALKSIEGYDRGFFCGVFGYFDGSSMQSAVSIRYIEKTEEGYVYKSGGGITYDSDANAEYAEMLQKVYLAF